VWRLDVKKGFGLVYGMACSFAAVFSWIESAISTAEIERFK